MFKNTKNSFPKILYRIRHSNIVFYQAIAYIRLIV